MSGDRPAGSDSRTSPVVLQLANVGRSGGGFCVQRGFLGRRPSLRPRYARPLLCPVLSRNPTRRRYAASAPAPDLDTPTVGQREIRQRTGCADWHCGPVGERASAASMCSPRRARRRQGTGPGPRKMFGTLLNRANLGLLRPELASAGLSGRPEASNGMPAAPALVHGDAGRR